MIGVFGGSGMNAYLLNNLLTNPTLIDELGWFLLRHTGNDKDFLTTALSYRLGLRGPSVNVQTACSTSLVAVHLAARACSPSSATSRLAGGVTMSSRMVAATSTARGRSCRLPVAAAPSTPPRKGPS